MRYLAIIAGVVVPLITQPSASGPEQPASDSVEPTVAAATAYVGKYQEALSYVLANETYVQEIRAQVPLDPRMPRTRTLTSTALFVFTPDTREWMSVRDVLSVDGKPVASRADIEGLLKSGAVGQTGAALKAQNSRFNIGRTYRNFNEPTLSLMVLDRANRANFRFEPRQVDTGGGRTIVTVAFTEHPSENPLIRDLDLKPALSKGELKIAAATGEIHEAAIEVTMGAVRARLSTSYGLDARLGMLVPTVFRERYEHGVEPIRGARMPDVARAGGYEQILCESRYREFRRFEGSAKIK